MLAVVKTPLTSVRIRGRIPQRVLDVLAAEFGRHLELTPDPDDELVDVFQTDWYRRTRKRMIPGDSLKIYRENKRMTQAELGKALGGLPRQHISNMEHGVRPISKKTALKLSRIFGVTVERFIG